MVTSKTKRRRCRRRGGRKRKKKKKKNACGRKRSEQTLGQHLHFLSVESVV